MDKKVPFTRPCAKNLTGRAGLCKIKFDVNLYIFVNLYLHSISNSTLIISYWGGVRHRTFKGYFTVRHPLGFGRNRRFDLLDYFWEKELWNIVYGQAVILLISSSAISPWIFSST